MSMHPIAELTPDRDVVLIIDDVPDNLAVLSDALEQAGFMVLVALDGQSALEQVELLVPDLILLDAVMPGLDGFETCRRLKTMDRIHHVPVIFMTGLTDTEHVVSGFLAGGVDYVTKPIRPEEVLARLETHLHNARLVMQAQQILDLIGHAILGVTLDGTFAWKSPRAQRWLLDYFPPAPQAVPVLPDPVRRWARTRIEAGANGDGVAGPPLVISRHGRRLLIHFLGEVNRREFLLLLEEQSEEEPAQSLKTSYNLTARESEVLLWVAKGKTNRDIGEILRLSPRTVNKHLEHIYVKLGVETRTAAAALAMNARSDLNLPALTWGAREPSAPHSA